MPAAIDITGQRFGRLVALGRAPSRKRCSMWLCQCDCGKTKQISTQSLRSGASQSCGCLNKEINAKNPNAKTHGMRKSPEYSVYCGIKRRCENQSERCYPRYGGRGIKCLFSSFEEFLEDVGKRPSPKHQIDRIDNNRSYEAGNLRWVLPKQQQRNRRDNRIVEVEGRKMTLAEACEIYGQDYRKVWLRIVRSKWSVERALEVTA